MRIQLKQLQAIVKDLEDININPSDDIIIEPTHDGAGFLYLPFINPGLLLGNKVVDGLRG